MSCSGARARAVVACCIAAAVVTTNARAPVVHATDAEGKARRHYTCSPRLCSLRLLRPEHRPLRAAPRLSSPTHLHPNSHPPHCPEPVPNAVSAENVLLASAPKKAQCPASSRHSRARSFSLGSRWLIRQLQLERVCAGAGAARSKGSEREGAQVTRVCLPHG